MRRLLTPQKPTPSHWVKPLQLPRTSRPSSVNRVLLPMINEAIYTLYEGVGTVESIDTAMKLGAKPSDGAA